jgi:hypothetical protein
MSSVAPAARASAAEQETPRAAIDGQAGQTVHTDAERDRHGTDLARDGLVASRPADGARD